MKKVHEKNLAGRETRGRGMSTEGKWGRELAASGRNTEDTDLPNIILYMEITGKQSSVGIGKWLSKTELARGIVEHSSVCRPVELQGSSLLRSLRSNRN